MSVYTISGRIGANQANIKLITAPKEVIEEFMSKGGINYNSQMPYDEAYTRFVNDLNSYGLYFDFFNIKFPYFNGLRPIDGKASDKMPLVYPAEIYDGSEIIFDGKNCGLADLRYANEDLSAIYIEGRLREDNIFPYIRYSASNDEYEIGSFVSIVYLCGYDCIVDGKFSLKGKLIRPVTFTFDWRIPRDTWRYSLNSENGFIECTESFIDGQDAIPDPEGDDPFNGGGTSGTDGGEGNFDNTSTPIEIPELPQISASSTGFVTIYNPTLAQLLSLSQYMWSDLFDIEGWRKIFANPMDSFLGLSIVPVSIPSSGAKEVKVGNIGTGLELTVASSQFVEVDCGSINVNEYWGAYLDYEPYTQAQIFLPYIGIRPISVDEIMNKSIRVVYHVDILTGSCCCFVKCGDSVLYTYNGQCSTPIPITSASYTNVVNGAISIAASVGSLVATGGASAPVALPNIANSAVNQMKPQVEKSGSISGSAGLLNMQTPYLILIRPRQALPARQNEFIGYPSLITVQLTELAGYTEVQSIHLENIPATQEELTEIQSLLEGGVIF